MVGSGQNPPLGLRRRGGRAKFTPRQTPVPLHTARVDTLRWLPTGRDGLRALLTAIEQAQTSIRLEMYIYRTGSPGDEIGAALTAAAARGVNVRIQLDALGSRELPDEFWAGLRAAGGEIRRFNPFGSGRYLIRDHRKLCVVDDVWAMIAGFNVSPEYDGDGVTQGWRDLGLSIEGPAARKLAAVFDQQYGHADRRPRLLARYQKRREKPGTAGDSAVRVLPVSPGRQSSCLLDALYEDLPRAHRVWACTPYFVPPPKLRRLLGRAARRGADVRLILPAQSDVPLAQLAARRLYSGLHRNGIQVYEYQPQILHAKLWLLDDAVYTGSSNLDPRSLHLNYEIMIRTTQPAARDAAEEICADLFRHSRLIVAKDWSHSRTWYMKLRERWAFFLLYRLDPWLTHGFSS